ncbi:hypothetical protein RF11_06063 [Thelohanellus kitauei]|uniref:Uncharacterized protein n=1 Tax=Thelohanellus kitauei TaxID=669202 RepID=A0A0C2MBT4_THEKT|nr:hypothetical protein RF11_06063 [Thelohanellus kitauei]
MQTLLICGGDRHRFRNDCPAKSAECFNCWMIGYDYKICIKKSNVRVKDSPRQKFIDSSDREQSIYHLKKTFKRLEEITIVVDIENKPIEMAVDNRVAVTCISYYLWRSIGEPSLEKCYSLAGYMNTVIRTADKMYVRVKKTQNKKITSLCDQS